MGKKIKAVIFDQDGLMFDTERLSVKAWDAALAPYGIKLGEDFFRDLRGARPEKGAAAFRERFGDSIDYDSIRKVKRGFSYQWVAEKGVPVKKGLKELLSYLKENGAKLAIATASSKEWTQGNVKGAGVDSYFDEFIYGDMVEEAKPDPAIFLLAAKRLGVEPGECMVLEDSFNGIRAAAAGGFYPVMVPDLTLPTPEIKALLAAECESLLEVIGLFKNGTFEL
ncbi:HAD family hydrolase [Lacrimispora sp. 210928-DFI.3.58]|uniref:HAD family hydrolase n=1 Tax=Lacrimispora sp. 210928-DFI.3.58 TaxID=2883214 RepID=UPI001D0620E8|nr:HAD family phosphatase [Lacrimispora sp. 210928-DFI.3.58]MCB7318389.1 HAD family phosphatase [Lacrimispora sp. 210928-DFI.3.58]